LAVEVGGVEARVEGFVEVDESANDEGVGWVNAEKSGTVEGNADGSSGRCGNTNESSS